MPLDELNLKQEVDVPLNEVDRVKLHVWTFTDGFTKVIRFSDTDGSTMIMPKDQLSEDENNQSLQLFEVNVKSSFS